MRNLNQNFILKLASIFIITKLTSCAMSMTPLQVNNTLPTLTNSKYLSQTQALESIKSNKCKYLIKGRKYTAPMGYTTKDDLKNGAKGIDEWVKLDGGNSYCLINCNWVTVDHNGSTQLEIEFDTMICE
jgi:hypothetical protein